MKLFSMLYVDRIKVEVRTGNIQQCVGQVIRLAKMLECDVDFEFNDFPMTAHPNSTEEEMLSLYWSEKA